MVNQDLGSQFALPAKPSFVRNVARPVPAKPSFVGDGCHAVPAKPSFVTRAAETPAQPELYALHPNRLALKLTFELHNLLARTIIGFNQPGNLIAGIHDRSVVSSAQFFPNPRQRKLAHIAH